MTMLSDDRHRRALGGAPRSGGRTARHGADLDSPDVMEHRVEGAVALAPRTRPVVREPNPAAAEANPVGPRLRVAPPAPVSTPRAPFVVLVLALVVAGVVGILVLNTKIAENAFRLDDLRQNQTTLDTREEQLQADIAEQAAPGTVAGKARELGMQLPTAPPTFIILPDGQKLDVPQPAVGRP